MLVAILGVSVGLAVHEGEELGDDRCLIEVADCLRAGATESALLPPDESLAIMKHLYEILRQLGVAPR